MFEEDKPYVMHIIDDGDLHTVGMWDRNYYLLIMHAQKLVDPMTINLESAAFLKKKNVHD
jgi:hypothetical protein